MLFFRYIVGRQESVHPQIHPGFQFPCGLPALYLVQGFFHQLTVHIITDRSQMTVLFRSKDIARTADFQVPHRDTETGAELRKLPDSRQPLLGRFRQHMVRPHREVGIGLPVAPAHPAPQLIKLAEAEPFRVIHNQGICVRHVQAVFNNGCAQQHVIVAVVEVQHHVFQLVFLHLPVGHAHPGFRHQCPQPLIEAADAPHPVVQKVDLSAPAEFTQDGVPDQGIGILRNHGLYRDPLFRRGFQHTHVTDARHRHMQGPRNRRRAQGEHVHLPLHVLDNFLMGHAEALLLVHDEQA